MRLPAVALGALLAGGCASYISPLQPPPYRDQIAAPYDATWTALIQALAFDNVPLRAIAKDSGVIASDDIVSPIGVYADCGSKGDKPLEGETIVSFTVFVRPNGKVTDLQINNKMRTFRLGRLRMRLDDPVGAEPGGCRQAYRQGTLRCRPSFRNW